MYIDKTVIITCFMICMACLFFMMLGYNIAYEKAVDYANEIINENMEKCNMFTKVNNFDLVYEPLDFNITGGVEDG